MRRKLLVVVLVSAGGFAFAPAAQAGPCGYSDAKPLWIDFGDGSVTFWKLLARPGNHVAASNLVYPPLIRARGAKTVYFDLHLNRRVGTPAQPADPAVIDEKAERLFFGAAQSSNCPTPYIILNELFGAHLETPWSPNNAQYRANVLEFLRGLARRGARPFLLISKKPYTGSPEAAEWWREVAKVSDIMAEVYFSAPNLWGGGAVEAGRRLRMAFRQAVGSLTAIGIPVERIGICLGFQVAPGTGGREGLKPARAWFETVKWQALAAKQVAREMRFATILSWGWATWSERSRDPDKWRAACVYLWTRNPHLCNGPRAAGPGFDRSRTEGQLILPAGAQCRVGRNTISMAAIARLNRLTGDRDVAFSGLYRRIAESRASRPGARSVLAAERAIVRMRFAGSRRAYLAALARAGAGTREARAIIADQLRRAEIGLSLRVPRPSEAAVRTFYFSYADVRVRAVHVNRSPWWLGGRRAGVAIAAFAPSALFTIPSGRWLTLHEAQGSYSIRAAGEVRELGTVPLAAARPSIAAGLHGAARDDAAIAWSARAQEALQPETTCRRDQLPVVDSVDLTAYAPFLALNG